MEATRQEVDDPSSPQFDHHTNHAHSQPCPYQHQTHHHSHHHPHHHAHHPRHQKITQNTETAEDKIRSPVHPKTKDQCVHRIPLHFGKLTPSRTLAKTKATKTSPLPLGLNYQRGTVDRRSLFENGANFETIPLNTTTTDEDDSSTIGHRRKSRQRFVSPVVDDLLQASNVCRCCKHRLKRATKPKSYQKSTSVAKRSASDHFGMFVNQSTLRSDLQEQQVLVAKLDSETDLEKMRMKAQRKEEKKMKKHRKRSPTHSLSREHASERGQGTAETPHFPAKPPETPLRRKYKERYFILKEIR